MLGFARIIGWGLCACDAMLALNLNPGFGPMHWSRHSLGASFTRTTVCVAVFALAAAASVGLRAAEPQEEPANANPHPAAVAAVATGTLISVPAPGKPRGPLGAIQPAPGSKVSMLRSESEGWVPTPGVMKEGSRLRVDSGSCRVGLFLMGGRQAGIVTLPPKSVVRLEATPGGAVGEDEGEGEAGSGAAHDQAASAGNSTSRTNFLTITKTKAGVVRLRLEEGSLSCIRKSITNAPNLEILLPKGAVARATGACEFEVTAQGDLWGLQGGNRKGSMFDVSADGRREIRTADGRVELIP